jgi:hypothetical protein
MQKTKGHGVHPGIAAPPDSIGAIKGTTAA